MDVLSSFQSNTWCDRASETQTKVCDQHLCDACRKGDVDLAQKAISEGADVNLQYRLALSEITPLFLCAQHGHLKIAQLLIENHVNINKRIDFDGTTCLHHAATNNQYEMVEFLVSLGLNINAVDKLNRTPLMDASEMGNEKIVKYLLDHHADVNIKDKEGNSALSYCLGFINPSQPQFEKCALHLIESGIDANSVGKFSNSTLLHYAARTGNIKLCQKLVEHCKATVLMYDRNRKTPIKLAQESHHDNVANYLIQHTQQFKMCCVL